VRFTSPSRRAAGLLAATTIGLSTAVLSVTGVASAAENTQYADGDSSDTDYAATNDFDVAEGTCAIDWHVAGADGNDASDVPTYGGEVDVVTRVAAGATVHLSAGVAAVPGSAQAGQPSIVTVDGTTLISATGGTDGTGTRAANTAPSSIAADPYDGDNLSGGYGFISAEFVDCPQAPYRAWLEGGDGAATLTFAGHIDSDYSGLDAVTGYQYQLDSGAWTDITAPFNADDKAILDIPMSNGVAHSVSVRAVSDAGYSQPLSAGTVTPYAPIGAPTITSVKLSTSTVTVTWTDPTVTGTFALAGYDIGYSGGDWGNQACETDKTVHTCTFSVAAGADYLVTVAALDSADNRGLPTRVQSGVVPAPAVPASLPTKDDGDITGADGPISKVTAGQKLTLQGAGFAPNSTVQLTVFSTPVSLGTTVADGTGAFSAEVTIPAGLTNGTHHLVASGVDASGAVRNLVTEVTLSGGTPALAYTGFSPAPYIGGGLVLLLAGAGLVVAGRRRRA